MTTDEFRALTREGQYLALQAMTDEESRNLSRSLTAIHQHATYERAASDLQIMTNPHQVFVRDRHELQVAFDKERAHLASPAHALAEKK